MANKGQKKPIPPDLTLKKIRAFRSWICEEGEEEPLLAGARNAQPDFQIPIVISLLVGPQQMRCTVVWAPKWPRQSSRGTSERSRRVNCAHSGLGGRRCGVRFRSILHQTL